MFTTLIVQPLFNLLVLIYTVLPGHNFGLAIIIFTIIIRLLLWPILKRQLHQTKAMRKLQPEMKRIKAAAKGNKQKEQQMLMEMYKERGINPLGTLPIMILQLIVLFGLYSGLRRVIVNPHALVTFAYPALQHTAWMKELAGNIHRFDETLFGVIHLNRSALNPGGGVYWPAMVIVLCSAIAQYFQAKQLLPQSEEQRGLRTILKEAGEGKSADQSEVNAAVGRSTIFILPVMIFLFTVNLASALGLYWLTSGIIAYIQQSLVLRKDETEMEALADKPAKKDVKAIPEAEVVAEAVPKDAKPSKSSSKNKKAGKGKKKRR